ncbi:MAG: TonB-dependent receptor [Ignavibacteria bacterium]|nr:TonB-dependent receptor [Ignavibacteria bacterium]
MVKNKHTFSFFYFYLLLLSLACFALPLHSQNFGKVVGTIINKETKSPIGFASISIEGTTFRTFSKTDGSFSLSRVPIGKCLITVKMLGYSTITKEVNVETGKATEITVEMEERPTISKEVVVSGEVPVSAASSKLIQALDFELRPRLSSQDLLRLVPGLFLAQHAGGGKAEQIFLRGFDADHGTDINITIDGIPVNMVSHGHGQGYADLHFVMPEVLKELEVHKGPYFVEHGNFGTAGTVKFNTLDDIEHNSFNLEAGKFGMFRAVSLVRLPFQTQRFSSYVAGEFLRNDSYFENKEKFKRFNLFAKAKNYFDNNQSLSLWASTFTSDWNASGQIPQRAVESGIISRYGAIDPTEGGSTERHNINLQYTNFSSNSYLFAQTYISHYHFRLFSNFTFFKVDSINGDCIEQFDNRIILGGRLEYSLNHSIANLNSSTLFGASVRFDDIENELWRVKARQRLLAITQASIKETNLSFYIKQDFRFLPNLNLQLGLRSDYFIFDLVDRLNRGKPEDITGVVKQHILSPKANITYSPFEHFDLFFNFGTGFHSNDARGVLSRRTERTLPKAYGIELGTRFSTTRFTLTFALWGLDLENELVFVGDEGTTEENGPTRRLGIETGARLQILDWLWFDTDISLSQARFKNLPEGENYVPLAPLFVTTAGLTARHPLGFDGSLRLRHISERPANEDNTVRALGSTICDFTVAYTFGQYKFGIIMENIFNVEWNEAQFDTESRLKNEPQPVSELHFTPGTPFTVRAKFEIRF